MLLTFTKCCGGEEVIGISELLQIWGISRWYINNRPYLTCVFLLENLVPTQVQILN